MLRSNEAVPALRTALPALSVLAAGSRAGVIQVPAQQPTIQAAIDAAAAGDEIIVAPGTYLERIDFLGKAISVRSSGGAAVTTVDGGHAGSTVSFTQAETSTSVLQGFMITGGTGSVDPFFGVLVGGGVWIHAAGPELTDLVITGNSASYGGGLIVVTGESLITTLKGCVILGNTASSSGGGVETWSGNATFDTCALQDNVAALAGGGLANERGHVTLRQCVVSGNAAASGGGVSSGSDIIDGFALHMQDCLVQGNHADTLGGGVAVSVVGELFLASFARIESCRFLGNAAPDGAAVHAEGVSPGSVDISSCLVTGSAGASAVRAVQSVGVRSCTVVDNAGFGISGSSQLSVRGCIVRGNAAGQLQDVQAEWSDIQGGWPGTGNVDVDPLFVDAPAGDYHLQPISPCRDSGEPGASFVVLDIDDEPRVQGGRIDIGADELTADCNGNGQADYLDIAAGLSGDCNHDGVPDECAPFADCDANGIPDACDIQSGAQHDCNGNGVPDACDIAAGTSVDADGDGVPDECQIPLMVPGEYPTIQEALNAAKPSGDTIVLADGVYSGPGNVELDFLGKAVLLTSAHGKEHCRIDGLHESRLARLSGGLGVQIRGLTVADCSETSGGALLCEGDSTLELSDCSFTGNEGGQGGVALLRDHADVGFTRCVLAGNAALMGGAVRVNAGTLRLESCTFWGNAATALNSKGGSVLATMGADVQLLDVILRGGTALHGAELYAQDAGTVITTSFSDVQGGEAGVGLATGGSLAWGAGTIDADPLFKGAASGDFRLAGGSPCTDSGDPSAPLDADGTRADMGAIPFVGWEDLGQALAGRTGLPVLHGQGTLIAGEKVVLALSGAAPHALTFLVLGGSTLFAPFKGGTLVPAFDVPLAGPVTDAEGAGALSGRWPLQAPHGFTVFLQAWIPDAAAPAGFSASNGLAAETR